MANDRQSIAAVCLARLAVVGRLEGIPLVQAPGVVEADTQRPKTPTSDTEVLSRGVGMTIEEP